MDEILSKTLTTGGAGMTGSYVDFGKKLNSHEMDVTNLQSVMDVCRKFKPRVILHLAADTNVDRCERDPGRSYFINSFGTYNVALAAKEYGAKLIYISTAGVFDGNSDLPYTDKDQDMANPQNHYSRSKYLGEIAIQNTLKDYIILRTGWLFGGGPGKDHKFVGKILEKLRDKDTKKIVAVNDTKGTPTYCYDLIDAVKRLIRDNIHGTYLLGNQGQATRYEIAQFLVSVVNKAVVVEPADSSMFQLDVKRIRSEAMQVGFKFMRSWQDALGEYVRNEW